MICPNCGAENRDGVRFCRQCGEALPMSTPSTSNATRCPQCGTPLRDGARFCKQCGQSVPATDISTDTSTGSTPNRCPNCGMLLRPEARFCHKCGTALGEPHQPAGPTCPQCGTALRPGARFCKQCGATIAASSSISSTRGSSARIRTPAPTPASSVGTASRHYYSSSGHLLPQQKISDRYLIIEKLAEGGMGAIYRAKDLRLDGKIVALKEMSEEKIPLSERQGVLEAFEREAELLAGLQHPNLTRVTDRFEEQGRHYMVMEFIKGETLEKLLERQSQPFPEERVLKWAGQLCDVLSFLHNQEPRPIIYRDIKPGNIMIVQDSDRVKLIDFGIARFYKPGKKKDTIPFGTEGYAPPEQYGKAQTDERADIYALGATLHQMLTLEEPRTNLMNLPPVRNLNRNASKRVASAIDKAVALNKDKRHQSMAEMWEALSGEAPRWAHFAGISGEKAQAEAPDASKIKNIPNIPFDVTPKPQGGSEPQVVYGEIRPNQSGATLTHTLHFEPGETVKLKSEVDWVKLSSKKIGPKGGDVTLTVDTGNLEPAHLELQGNLLKRWIGWHTSQLVPTERTYLTDVVARSTGGKERHYPVVVKVKPSTGQQVAGWMGTFIAMLVELGAAGGIAATILIAVGII